MVASGCTDHRLSLSARRWVVVCECGGWLVFVHWINAFNGVLNTTQTSTKNHCVQLIASLCRCHTHIRCVSIALCSRVCAVLPVLTTHVQWRWLMKHS